MMRHLLSQSDGLGEHPTPFFCRKNSLLRRTGLVRLSLTQGFHIWRLYVYLPAPLEEVSLNQVLGKSVRIWVPIKIAVLLLLPFHLSHLALHRSKSGKRYRPKNSARLFRDQQSAKPRWALKRRYLHFHLATRPTNLYLLPSKPLSLQFKSSVTICFILSCSGRGKMRQMCRSTV